MSSFPANSAFEVPADQARQRIAAINLAGVVAQHSTVLRNVDQWHRQLQSNADTIDDVLFDLGDDKIQVEDCVNCLQEVSRSMERVLRSMRDTSANHPSRTAGSGEDHVDEDDVSSLREG